MKPAQSTLDRWIIRKDASRNSEQSYSGKQTENRHPPKVAAKSHSPLEREIEYISVEEEDDVEWEEPHSYNSAQDPLSIEKKECSASVKIDKTEAEELKEKAVTEDNVQECKPTADILGTSTVNTETSKDEEEENEDVVEVIDDDDDDDDFEEIKHDVELTDARSETKSTGTAPIGMEDDNSDDDTNGSVTNVSLDAGAGKRTQGTTDQEATLGNESVATHLVHRCDICKKAFAELQQLKEHTRSGACKPHSCSVCDKSFHSECDVRRHIRVHTAEHPYSCGICSMTFTQISSLRRHMQLHSGERPYSCDVCHQRFSRISNRKEHYRLHTGEKPYCCNFCQKKFTHYSSCRKHVLIHMKDR